MNYQFYSACIPVKGYLRSVIYDLQMGEYFFMPNDIKEMLEEDIPNPFVEKLLDCNLIYDLKEFSHTGFKSLNNEKFDYPAAISNAIVEVTEYSDLDRVFDILDQVNCRNIQLAFIPEGENRVFFSQILDRIRNSPISYCELVMSYGTYIEIKKNEIAKSLEAKFLFIYDAPAFMDSPEDNSFGRVFYTSQALNPADRPFYKNEALFQVNTPLYMESLEYNNYYYKKMFIDRSGNIMNGPLAKVVFGNIYDEKIDIHNIIDSESFKRLWKIDKGRINVCNVCEFRYMCVDERVPVIHKDPTKWYHQTECNYNPFIAKWKGQKGYKSLEECGVQLNFNGLLIDDQKLEHAITFAHLNENTELV